MSGYQKDPVDQFVESALKGVVEVAWVAGATAVSLIAKLVRTPPEKKLKKMKKDSTWGEKAQFVACPGCREPNDPQSVLCLACGRRL